MSHSIISCPGGSSSQTGTAVNERYPNAQISNSGRIAEVQQKLDVGQDAYVVPIWNSHQGEVKEADYVWNLIQTASIKIHDIWAKRIEFWFVRRVDATNAYGKIGSVVVAETQCSCFLHKKQAQLIRYPLTTDAHEAYRNGAELDGVLVAPGQGKNEVGFEVVETETANGNNFTTFVKLTSSHGANFDEGARIWISGVSMRPLNTTLGEAEQSFFSKLFESANCLEDIPKLIFVFDRTSKVGLLFEGVPLYPGDLLDAEEIEAGDISVYEEAGRLSQLYTTELSGLFNKEFSDLIKDDFILHSGVNTCLFACPTLNIYTHGYKIETVEPVVRFYISKLFELIDNGAKCSSIQKSFFDKHKVDWMEKGSGFIKFKLIEGS